MFQRLSHLISALLLVSTASSVAAAELCNARSGPQVTPLVELYTSEGCSSCPHADRWLSQRLRTDKGAANWLAFHVDYWDDLGWPDRFASPRYTERQRQRVGALGGTTVYTPQVMLGENVRAQWRNEASFARALADARIPASVGLAMSLHRDLDAGSADQLELRLAAVPVEGRAVAASVWLAESVDGQITDVRAGENGGVRLQHDRVVRKLWGPWPLRTDTRVERVQVASKTADFTVFVQDEQGKILQSLRLPSGCRK